MTRNTQRKIRALATWHGQSMSGVIAELIAKAYLDALVAGVPRNTPASAEEGGSPPR